MTSKTRGSATRTAWSNDRLHKRSHRPTGGRTTRWGAMVAAASGCLALIASGWTAPAGASGGFSVTFASTTAFSGPSSFQGTVVGGVLKAAQAYLDSVGGILGHKVAIKFVDTKGDPADAVPATEKFVSTTSHVMLDDQLGTTDAPALVPIVNRAKIPIWASAGNSIYDHQTKYHYFWRAVTPDAANGVAIALYIKKTLHLSHVGVVFGSTSGAQGDLPGVLAGARALKLKVVNQTRLTPAQPSYQSQVAALLAANPQVIVTEADPVTSATFWGEFAQQTSKDIPIIATAGTEGAGWTAPVSKDMGTSRFSKEVRRVVIASPKPTPAGKLFATWATKDSGATKTVLDNYLLSSFGEYDWDGIMIAALAAVDAGSTTPSVWNTDIAKVANPGKGKTVVYSFAQGEKLLKEHKQIEYVGASGPFDFNRYHNSTTYQVAQKYSNGSWHRTTFIPAAEIARYKVPNVA
jgi:branched-chain amino acid transport system substrate-binding protein